VQYCPKKAKININGDGRRIDIDSKKKKEGNEMKANYESVNTYVEVCKAIGQSMVECRLNGTDVRTVLLTEPRASLEQATCDNGEVRYSGKLTVSFLYENTDGELCRAERGAEFFHKAEDAQIATAHVATGELTVLSVKTKREGGQIVVACVVEGAFTVRGDSRQSYLSGGEDLLVKKTPMLFCSEYVGSATVEESDEFECDFTQDVLLHVETATVTDVRAGVGEAEIYGEVYLHFCALRQDGSLCAYERLTPIKAQVPLDAVMPQMPVTGRIRILSTQVAATADESRGRSKIAVSYRVEVAATAYERQEIEVGTDAYSTTVEVGLKTQKVAGRYALNTKTLTERIHGAAILSAETTEGKNLLASVFPKANATAQKTEQGWSIEGVIEGKALYRLEGGGAEAVDISLPFAFPISEELNAEVECGECAVYGFSLRVRADGNAEAEATIKVGYVSYLSTEASFLCEVTEGEKKAEKTNAISVYVGRRGDDLWTTAKRLSLTPEGLQESEPALTFPLTGEERILIYRRKRENLEK